MKHFGDITKLKGSELPIVDIITGGSPCQDLSVAGKRAGLDGERSGLFMEQIRIIKEMREYDRANRGANVDIRLLRPRYMVWENVQGAFSSNKGKDFHAVLQETARIADKNAVIPELAEGGRWTPSGCILGNGWSIAWRVHDAQFWGVPQRRKRIALVADFGGSSAPKILFERESVSGDSEQSGAERETVAGDIGSSIAQASRTISFQERAGKPGGARESLSKPNGQEPCQHLTINTSYQAEVGKAPISFGNGQLHDAMSSSIDIEKKLNCMDDPAKVVCYGLDRASFNQGKNAQYDFAVDEDLAQTLVSKGPGGVLTQ